MGMGQIAFELATVSTGSYGRSSAERRPQGTHTGCAPRTRETRYYAYSRSGSGPDEPCRDCDAVSGPLTLSEVPLYVPEIGGG